VASLAAHLPINAFVVDLHEIASEKKGGEKLKYNWQSNRRYKYASRCMHK